MHTAIRANTLYASAAIATRARGIESNGDEKMQLR